MTLRHDPLTIRLHWATAVLVLALWGTAQCIDYFPKGPPRWNARSVHMLLGVLLGVLLVWRIRQRGRMAPALRAHGAAAAVHHLLYALLVAAVLLGLGNAWVRGDHVFEWFQIAAAAPEQPALRKAIGTLHEWVANSLLIVAGLHALAALFHHHVLHDGVLRRMTPGRDAAPETAQPRPLR